MTGRPLDRGRHRLFISGREYGRQAIRTEYGDQADAVLALYPAADYPVPSRALADIRTR